MKNALEWIKTNPISVVAAFVALIGILIFSYGLFVTAPNFRTERSEILEQPYKAQKALQDQPVPIPNEDPNAEPIIERVVINARVISQVKDIYEKIGRQYDEILANTQARNAERHRSVMLGRGEIWPDAPESRFDLYTKAKEDYLTHFKAVFTYDPNNPYNEGWNMPSMVASSPPQVGEIELELARTAFNFINSIGVSSASELTQDQAEQLYAEQRTVLMSMLTERARNIHIYAQLPAEEDIFAPEIEETDTDGTGVPFPGAPGIAGPTGQPGTDNLTPEQYPFKIAPWARLTNPPKPDELWEGQVELWIVRDIMQAIADTNQVGKMVTVTNAEGEPVLEPASVVNSPIKRLLRLHPLPGYVGLHTLGGVLESSKLDAVAGTQSSSNPFAQGPGPRETQGFYPAPPQALAPKAVTNKAEEHFGITPTGRISNAVFDVRHTRLIIDIEWTKLPDFIEQLRQINFMSVVGLNLQDIDEYEVMREGGFVYGSSDVVRAELVIESLWFRNWTEAFMPKTVKEKLLIIKPQSQPTPYDQSFDQPF